jgi:hypothetical protein
MIKFFSAVILLFLLMPVNPSFAQASTGGIKVYSGYFHQFKVESQNTFWHSLFSPTFPKQDNIVPDMECTIEFKSPIPFHRQPVTEVPKELSYIVKFKNTREVVLDNSALKRKFIINIYTNDDQEYSIDPEAEGGQIGLNEEHHIVDSYLIYLILGTGNINHLEIASPSPDLIKDKYVLDKFEIHDNH